MIDLHAHTNESDGSLTPAELVDRAIGIGLEALAITDHDTFAGYETAAPEAAARGLELVRGIELNTFFAAPQAGRKRVNAHLLAYFLNGVPGPAFVTWLTALQASRRDRNARLVQKLRSMGVDITIDEVETLGRSLTGRPHFARLLVQKGYAGNNEDAFRRYLGEDSPGYVAREAPETADAIARVRAGGGVPVLAHPVRLQIHDAAAERHAIAELRDAGLAAMEVWHSDHGPREVERYARLVQELDLAPSGGSDFHGAAKPDVALGTGRNGNVAVRREILDGLRARAVLA